MTTIKLKYLHEYRHKKLGRLYFVRMKGLPKIRLRGDPGSDEFMATYHAALARAETAEKKAAATAGTFRDLVDRYFKSSRFTNLSKSSQKLYRLVLEKLVEEHGKRTVSLLDVDKAEKIIADIGATKPGMANLTRSILSAVFKYAVKLRLRADNPFSVDAIDPYKLGTHHTWTDEELERFRRAWPLGTRERLAFAVLLYTGQRVSDAVQLKRSDLQQITQQKTGRELFVAMHPALARAIKAGPTHITYIIGSPAGEQMTSDGLTKLMATAIEKAGLPDRCVAHGLRKANQRILAENKATVKQMQAISGHKSLRETQRYSEQADQMTLAISAMALFPDEE